MFSEYRSDRRYTGLDGKHEAQSLDRLQTGRRIRAEGRSPARTSAASAIITTAVTDALYEKLLTVTDAGGNVIGERRTSVNHAMKCCRRAWNVVARRHPGKLPPMNPFAPMGLRSSDRETPTATFEELQDFPGKGGRDWVAVAGHSSPDRLGMVTT